MPTNPQDDVKVAVYSANIPASNTQRSQDLVLAVLLSLAAVVGLGLGQYF
ncbi:MAG: hypothetical protein ACFB2W_28965 [Leptolyngbyaceae cyanobacterium]